MIKDIIESSLQNAAVQLGCSRDDLRLVGRPELIYAMFLHGELPDCIFIMTSKIPEHLHGDMHSSELMIVHREDVWTYF